MSVYDKGEVDAVKKEPMRLKYIGRVVLNYYTNGSKLRARAWLLYNFDVNASGYVIGDKKLSDKLIANMKLVARRAFEKNTPMSEWTKPWMVWHGIGGASKSKCYGELLKKFASSDDAFENVHAPVILYGMTDQASGISPLNAMLRRQRMIWVEKTWFRENKPKDVSIVHMSHKATNKSRYSYYQRNQYHGKIDTLKTKRGRAQHRSVMIFALPPLALSISKQLSLAKKYKREIINYTIKALKKQINNNPTRRQSVVLCMLNKFKSESKIDFRYFTKLQARNYIIISNTDYERQKKYLPKDKRSRLKPGSEYIYNPKTHKYDPIKFYSDMREDIYKSIRCARDSGDFIDRCGRHFEGMRNGWNHVDSVERASPGDALTSPPALLLVKWIGDMQGNPDSINSCAHAFNR